MKPKTFSAIRLVILISIISLLVSSISLAQEVSQVSEQLQATPIPTISPLPTVKPVINPTPNIAVASNSCCGYTSSGNPYPCCHACSKTDAQGKCIEWFGAEQGNCTWWAWAKYKEATGISLPGYGNAKDWKRYAQPDGSPPRVGSIVVFQPCVYGAHCASIPACPNGCGHVAYVYWVDNPTNPTKFKTSNMGCSGNCTIKYYGPYSVISGVNFIYPPNSIDITKPNNPSSVTSSSHIPSQWSANTVVTVSWTGATDPGNPTTGIGGYSWAWTQDANTVPDTQQESDENTSQTNSPPLATGKSWYFHSRARDKSNNWADGATHYGPFWIDANDPSNPSVQETHGAADAWQNFVNDPAFTWSGASDGNGSGIAFYTFYWGGSPGGIPVTQTTQTSFDPPAPCGASGVCTQYLRLKTTDVSGRSSQSQTLYTFRYDGQMPIGTFQINNGSEIAFQTTVNIHVDANDVGSGLYQMRLSNDGQNWPSSWQAYETDSSWSIDAYPNITQTVHLELRDLAGNATALPTQSIQLDLSGSRPRSANYQIMTDVQGRGGDLTTSSLYSLTSTIGQAIAGNGINGQAYKLESGFHGAWLAQPGPPPTIEHYLLLNSVIGQGGGVKFSQNYQLNSTTGQPAQTGERASANYQLTSGFWALVANAAQTLPTPTQTALTTQTPINTSTPPTTTPPATSTITPPPEFYGVSINQAALFTHDYQVTLYLDAPDAVEMMVSNDGGFGGAYWEAYAATKTWEIDFYQNYVLPRTVYVRYRDADGKIYGNFTDDIIYDPNLPTGTASIASVGNGTVSLSLNLQDDLSGMAVVKIVSDGNFETAPWEPYSTAKAVAAQPGDVIYVFYRDKAGNESLYPFELDVPGGLSYLYLPLITR
jgi:hypothetical protein